MSLIHHSKVGTCFNKTDPIECVCLNIMYSYYYDILTVPFHTTWEKWTRITWTQSILVIKSYGIDLILLMNSYPHKKFLQCGLPRCQTDHT